MRATACGPSAKLRDDDGLAPQLLPWQSVARWTRAFLRHDRRRIAPGCPFTTHGLHLERTTPLLSVAADGSSAARVDASPASAHRDVQSHGSRQQSAAIAAPAGLVRRVGAVREPWKPAGAVELQQAAAEAQQRGHVGDSVAPPGAQDGPAADDAHGAEAQLLPDPQQGEDEAPEEERGREVYTQFTRIKDPTARRERGAPGQGGPPAAARVTAYCTASSYQMGDVMRFPKSRAKLRGSAPKRFDECIYSPYDYGQGDAEPPLGPTAHAASPEDRPRRRFSDSMIPVEAPSDHDGERLASSPEHRNPLAGGSSESSMSVDANPFVDTADFDTQVHTPEVFLFDYGTVVMWGMTSEEERRFLKELTKFESEKLDKDSIQTEDFNFYYTREYQARIYNDFISLREKRNYMAKLAISHALSQSVKVRHSVGR